VADLWMDVDAALAEVPINIMPLIDDTDFKTIEASVAFNAAGLALKWNFVTVGGAMSQTAVTPTNTGGDYDWVSQGNGMYSIEIPASGGASINNDTEGFGWFTGVATGVLPWRGPVIGFRAAGLNNLLIENAFSTTRGLAGTAVPDAAADAAGGLPISDAGGLDLDARLDVAVSSRLAPTTAGRTLDVTTAGNAGIDWGNVENPTTALNLSGTNIDTDQVVASVTGAVGSVTGAVGSVTGNVGGNVNGNVVGTVASVVGNVGGNVTGSVGSVVGNVGGSVASVVGNVGGNLNGNVVGNVNGNVLGSVDSVVDPVSIAVNGIPSGAIVAAELNAIADALLDRNMAAGVDSGTDSTAFRTPRQAFRRLRNLESITAGNGVVMKEDDTTPSWTYVATTTAGNPLSAVDPA